MKSALRWLGWLIAVAIAGYFVWFAFRTFSLQDLSALATLPVIGSILLGACLYAMIVPISGGAWVVLLRRQDETWRVARLAAILAVTQLAKYIPGGVAQPVGRAAMSLRHGMKLRAFTASVIQETVLAIAASVTVGVGLLLLSPSGIRQIPITYRGVVLAGALAAVASVLLLASGSALLPKGARNSRWISPALRAIGPAPGANATLIAFSAYCLNYLVIGVGIWFVAQALGLAANGSYTLLTAAFSLAWLLGFAMPGAPAGLGVREGVMALLLAGPIAQHQTLALVIAIRLVTLAGDGLCFGLGLWGLRRVNQEERNAH